MNPRHQVGQTTLSDERALRHRMTPLHSSRKHSLLNDAERRAQHHIQDAVMSEALGNTVTDALDLRDLMKTFTSLPWR